VRAIGFLSCCRYACDVLCVFMFMEYVFITCMWSRHELFRSMEHLAYKYIRIYFGTFLLFSQWLLINMLGCLGVWSIWLTNILGFILEPSFCSPNGC